jgi:hypothetical protein
MINSMGTRRSRRQASLVAVAAIAAFFALFAASAGAGVPSNMSWTTSNNQVGASGVTYSYSFTPAATGIIKSITFVVSGTGLSGTPTIARNFGIGAGAVALAGQTITYTSAPPSRCRQVSRSISPSAA